MSLDTLREKIDVIDKQIIELLSRRAAAAIQVGRQKQSLSLEICDPSREGDVLAKVSERLEAPLTEEGAFAIYREIISVCSKLQADLEDE